MKNPISVGSAARLLGVSPDWVRQLERSQKIRAIKTDRGIRLFEKSEIEAFSKERQQQKSRIGRG